MPFTDNREGMPLNNRPRRPWVAAILTVLTTGLGHVYSGEAKRGLILFGIGQILFVLAAAGILFLPSSLLLFILLAMGGFAFIVFCVVDAARIAKERKETFIPKAYNRWYAYVVYFIVLSFLAEPLVSSAIKSNLLEAYKMPSGSMLPSLVIGDHFLTNKLPSSIREPKRGDIFVFPFPEEPSRDFIKRLIAIEGDVVEIKNKRLYLNGKEQSETYAIHTDSKVIAGPRDNFGPVTVPPGKLFFLGDNRDQSYDSRFWGFVPKSSLKGKATNLYWSWDFNSGKVRWDRIGKQIQ